MKLIRFFGILCAAALLFQAIHEGFILRAVLISLMPIAFRVEDVLKMSKGRGLDTVFCLAMGFVSYQSTALPSELRETIASVSLLAVFSMLATPGSAVGAKTVRA